MDGRLTETVIDEDAKRSYTFEATFGFMRRLKESGIEPAVAFESVQRGEIDPDYLEGILAASLVAVDDHPVKSADKAEIVVSIIERFGIAEASALSSHMLFRAWIGDIKKSQADMMQIRETIQSQLSAPFRLMSFVKAGWPWMVASMLSGVLGCVIFSFFGRFI